MPLVVNALKEWKFACPLHDTGKKDAEGNPIKELWLVFPNGAGNVEDHHHLDKRNWQPLQVAAGVTAPAVYKRTGAPKLDEDGNQITGAKYSGLHALRHFFASWCLDRRENGGLGLDMKTTQVRCGHSSIQVTMDTYAHLIPATDTAAQMAAATLPSWGSDPHAQWGRMQPVARCPSRRLPFHRTRTATALCRRTWYGDDPASP